MTNQDYVATLLCSGTCHTLFVTSTDQFKAYQKLMEALPDDVTEAYKECADIIEVTQVSRAVGDTVMVSPVTKDVAYKLFQL